MVSAAITGKVLVNTSEASKTNMSASSNKVQNDFGSVMKESLKNNASANADRTDNKEKNGINNSVNSASASKSDTDKTECSGQNRVKEASADTSKDNLSDDTVSKLEKAADKVADKIKEKLGISDEELEQLMAELGITMLDLLKPENLMELFMQYAGTDDPMFLVTDTELSLCVKDIMNTLEQVTAQFCDAENISPEQFAECIEECKEIIISDVKEETSAAVKSDESDAFNVDDMPDSELAEQIDRKLSVSVEGEQKSGANESASDDEVFMDKSDNEVTQDINDEAQVPVNNLTETFKAAFADAVDDVNPAEVVRQVVQEIKLNSSNIVKSIEIQLNPERLGNVNVVVAVKEGIVSAHITTENEQVKRALESQMITIKETFENQGVKVDAVEVTVRSSAFESNENFAGNNNEEQTPESKRRINLDELFAEEEPEEELQTAALQNENSSVEYMA